METKTRNDVVLTYSIPTVPVLGYWRNRGTCQHIRLLLKYIGLQYKNKVYNYGPSSDYKQEKWLVDKFHEFHPYWIEGSLKLIGPEEIMKHLATHWAPQLIPQNPKSQEGADILERCLTAMQKSLMEFAYAPAPAPAPAEAEPEPEPEAKNKRKFEQLTRFLAENKWVLGDKLSYVDFQMFEVLHQFRQYKRDIFKPYPSLEKYIQRFKSIPELTMHINSTSRLPCFSAHATVSF